MDSGSDSSNQIKITKRKKNSSSNKKDPDISEDKSVTSDKQFEENLFFLSQCSAIPLDTPENFYYFFDLMKETLNYAIFTQKKIPDQIEQKFERHIFVHKNINGLNETNPNLSIRDMYSLHRRQLVFVSECLLIFLKYASDCSLFDGMYEKIQKNCENFAFYKTKNPLKYSLFELKMTIAKIRQQLTHMYYTKDFADFVDLIKIKVAHFTIMQSDVQKSSKRSKAIPADKEWDFHLFCKYDDEKDKIVVSDFFLDFFETWIYNIQRKFYLCTESHYKKIGLTIFSHLRIRYVNKVKEVMKIPEVCNNIENIMCQLISKRLILTSDREQVKKYGDVVQQSETETSTLYAYRRSVIIPYILIIRERSGLIDVFRKKLDLYQNNLLDTKERDIIFDETLLTFCDYILRSSVGIGLQDYVIREESLLIPFKDNDFFINGYPCLIQNFRGWALFDFSCNKLLNYKSFLENFVGFLYSVRLLERSIATRHCVLRNNLVDKKSEINDLINEIETQ